MGEVIDNIFDSYARKASRASAASPAKAHNVLKDVTNLTRASRDILAHALNGRASGKRQGKSGQGQDTKHGSVLLFFKPPDVWLETKPVAIDRQMFGIF